MSCTSCRRNPCCCLRTSTPYYLSSPTCSEDNTQEVITQEFAFGICPSNSWNVPECGQSAVLNVGKVLGVTIGAFMWHPNYGYFEIQSVDQDAETITISNPCNTGNAAPGVQIPACTCFTVTPPSCCEGTQQDGVFVAYDFTAPANSTCLDITLTGTEGLIVNNNVQIGSGVYFLDAIKANNVVTICNQGEGIVEGTPVVAQNEFGFYQYPVQLLLVNPCGEDPVDLGTVLVCVDGIQQPLTGDVVGSILVLQDTTTGEASYEVLPTAPTYQSVLQTHTSAPVVPTLLDAGTPSFTSNIAGVTITNPNTTRTMNTLYNVTGTVSGERTIPTGADWLELAMSLQVRIDGGGWSVKATVVHSWEFVAIDPLPEGFQVTWTGILPVAVSNADLIEARIEITMLTAAVTNAVYDISTMDVTIAAYGSTV